MLTRLCIRWLTTGLLSLLQEATERRVLHLHPPPTFVTISDIFSILLFLLKLQLFILLATSHVSATNIYSKNIP